MKCLFFIHILAITLHAHALNLSDQSPDIYIGVKRNSFEITDVERRVRPQNFAESFSMAFLR